MGGVCGKKKQNNTTINKPAARRVPAVRGCCGEGGLRVSGGRVRWDGAVRGRCGLRGQVPGGSVSERRVPLPAASQVGWDAAAVAAAGSGCSAYKSPLHPSDASAASSPAASLLHLPLLDLEVTC